MTLPKSLRRPYLLTHLGLWAERVTHAAWPLWSVFFVGFALWGTGLLPSLSTFALWAVFVLLGAGLLYGLWHGRTFRAPTKEETLARLDAALPGRPIQALNDAQTIGSGDAASEVVWQAHLARMEAKLAAARAVEPDLRVSSADPYALRYAAVLLLAVTVLFGGIWRGADLSTGLGAGPADALQTGPAWEVWLEPPRYTGKPTLYLADIEPGPIEVPAGSEVLLRFYGQIGALSVSETLSGRDAYDPTEPNQSFAIAQSGTLAITGDGQEVLWSITLAPDAVPNIRLEEMPTHEPPSAMRMPFAAEDDYGIVSGVAQISLDLEAVDRRYGLAVAPEPREDLVLDLPLPISGDRTAFSEILVDDVSKHPFANLPVRIELVAIDAAQQKGSSTAEAAELPGRGFFDPLANALIEQRRDLLWSRENQKRAAQILRTMTHRAGDTYDSSEAYILTRQAIRMLERTASLSSAERDAIAEVLWQAALKEEEGNLESALERMRQAQERLSEAIRQGASPEEIERLMDELRQAMDEYMRQLAQEQAQNPQSQDQAQNQQQQEQREITRDQLDELMDRIQELMEQGRTAEAQQLLQELQRMMENLEVTQNPNGQGGEGQQNPGEQAMQDLRDTLREQQGLSDEAFRELQEQFNPNAQAGENQGNEGRNGGQGRGESHEGDGGEQEPSGQDGGGQQGEGSLSQRQSQLRGRLNELQRNMPGQGTPEGDAARDALDRAGRAMDRAAEGLAEDRLADAIDQQSQAMDALREGMDQLGQALAEAQQQGQGQQEGQDGEDAQAQAQDPLGRAPGTTGQIGTDENLLQGDDVRRRARDLLDEIRRRSAEQDRPEVERDYLNRLLDRF